MRIGRILKKTFVYAFLIIAFVVSIYPFLWMIIGSTNSAVDVVKGKMTFGNQFGNNIKALFSSYDIKTVFFNSLKISVLSTIGTLIIGSMAAYGFEVYYSKARERLYNIVLVTMMVPFAALMIPLFKLIVTMHLINTHLAIIIVTVSSVFLLFFFRQNMKAFPKDIIQAARVDGAGEFRIFWSIVVPSMKSTFAAAAIFAFMNSWNAYLWPLIVLQTDNKKTMTLLISTMSSAYFPQYGQIMAAIVIATLPMILVFFTLQKYFVQGITGSVKQ